MKTILHNRISETSYNVELAIFETSYTVTYGKQVESYEKSPQGLIQACGEYIECVEHAKKCEKAGGL